MEGIKNIPTVGDIIYVDTDLYIGHGVDDVLGGKAKVTKVEYNGVNVMVTVEQFPTTSYNWRFLEPDQSKLKEEFGDSWARPNPDYRPEFNEG